jgi:bifunctional UDP-N-acetylglucosamine pyrophosphorylase/glucosamine-1-phosphate N-acetyltransferase
MAQAKLTVVILAAGLGKRMASQLPKVLHPVLGEPMLGHVLRTAEALNPTQIVVVTGHGRVQVENWLATRTNPLPIRCIEQVNPNGTGHAMLCAQPAWQDADQVLILYGDVPLLRVETLRALVGDRGDRPLALLVAHVADPTGYGRVVLEGKQIARVVEHKDANEAERQITAVNAGMMAVRADFLKTSLAKLTPNNAQGELYLTDLVGMAADSGQPGIATIAGDASEIQGVNNRAELSVATGVLRKRVNFAWMMRGVAMDEPESTWIETDVQIEPDASLGAGVELRGRTSVAAGARIDRGCVLRDVTVAAHAQLLPYTVAHDAIIGEAAHVGPFAHLRPGTELAADVKVGNFVETKKAKLGVGAKASHLSYLGDADIGPGCNIGAGTITCNYDGVNKFKTTLGAGVFIGSDTQLVAPVTLGDEAYVGAGSTITQDVPAGALALTRVEQKNILGWTAKKKARQAAAKAAAKK